ncbi:hypothetical protein EG347_11070 [Chryseobacterium sp. G0186]|uniref:hypothetical protein n=1 Tax=Chryseobacterium sp. G0186 TaxID=2487064 RepID=UPI000F507610|nr:hypothetical protein [Chryseobacterium sp. G0186]AZA78019.1 hypothetical protein EG347_11070 [Chryseobacterium sp. G0186]
MKFKLFLILFTFSIIKILGTGQQPDKIIINNKEYDLLNNPLDAYFEKHPDDHPIYGPKIRKKTEKELMIPFSTSNYRGYIATFKIENNTLSLVDLKLLDLDSGKDRYISVFKKIFGDRKVDLNYSGILVIPTGELLESAHFGYSYLYDKYHLMTIQRDAVIKEKELNKDEFIRFKVDQFKAYKNTEEYKTEVKNHLKSWNGDKKFELSRKNTRGMSKKEIAQLKKEYEFPPSEEHINNFLFVLINPDFVIIDY